MSSEPADSVPSTPPAVVDESNLIGSILKLAWPVVVQQVSFSMVQLVDTALVGRLGEDSLAGVRLAAQLFWFAISGMVAVGVGATAIIARHVGAGQGQHASRTLHAAFVLAFLWGLFMGIGMWFFGSLGLELLGAEEGARAEGTTYLSALAFGMPVWALIFAGNASLQGAGDTRTPMIIGVVVNIINAIFSYVLINGTGPFPQLDVLGAGVGFVIAGVVGAMSVLGVLASGSRVIVWRPWDITKLDTGEMKRVLNIGVPTGVEQMQFTIAFAIYTRIIASLGTTAVAAHGVVLAIQGLTFNVGFALSVATAAIVGQSLGAKRPELAEKATYATMRYSIVFTVLLGIIFMIFGRQITGVFVAGEDAPAVMDIGQQLLFIFGFAMPGLAVSLAISGSLRGAGDTRAVLYIMAGTTWIVRLVPAYVLAIVLGLGVPGAWLAAILDINIRALLMWLRFRQGRWKSIKV